MMDVNTWRERCYAGVSAFLYSSLRQFRARFPYKSLAIDGKRWRYILTDGGPEVLLMLPGSTATGESNWREIIRLSERFRVLSVSYPPVKSTEALLKGLLAVLDAENIGRMNVFGASLGGAIAQWLIRNYPERVNKLILLSIGIPGQNAIKEFRKAIGIFSLIPGFGIRRMFESEAKKLVGSLPEDEAALMAAYFRDLYRNDIDKRTIICHFRFTVDLARNVSLLGLDKPFLGSNPVLILHAADDEIFDQDSRNALIATYPKAKTHLFPSGGHTLFSRRTEVNQIIDSFLESDGTV